MADEHSRVPPPQPPLASAPPTSPATPAPAALNGEARTPVVAPHAPPAGDLRSLAKSLWELVWPPTGTHIAQADSIREVVETVVFVVVLVLLLKSFAAEAFVIPTGSMAETLWGYQKVIVCPECGFVFPVNCSQEVDPQQEGEHSRITACICPNCAKHIEHVDDDKAHPEWHWNSGDRVLVAKSLFELGLMKPERREVVVFKFPGDESWPRRGPQLNHVPMNYIKRLIGLGGETIGIWYGRLYLMTDDRQDEEDLKANPLELWQKRYMHENKFRSELERLYDTPTAERRFHILRKPPSKILSLRRPVYDNDHPAKDLPDLPRWGSDQAGAWAAGPPNGFHAAGGDGTAWLRYSHVLRPEGGPARKQLITDVMGYNDFESVRLGPEGQPEFGMSAHPRPTHNWVGDLILECSVTVEKPAGELTLELSKGVDRFRARWDLQAGTCSLYRVGADGEKPLGESKPSPLGVGAEHRLRFANVDDRLTVWVDSTLPFGDGVDYEAARELGPTAANDLQPASIGASKASLTVQHLKLWRDTYYTQEAGPGAGDGHLSAEDWGDPTRWEPLRHLPARTFFVQPGHYLCLGDNSPESSDGRTWGTVPERLMLGRALLVYYPFKANFWPLYAPVNRFGPIR